MSLYFTYQYAKYSARKDFVSSKNTIVSGLYEDVTQDFANSHTSPESTTIANAFIEYQDHCEKEDVKGLIQKPEKEIPFSGFDTIHNIINKSLPTLESLSLKSPWLISNRRKIEVDKLASYITLNSKRRLKDFLVGVAKHFRSKMRKATFQTGERFEKLIVTSMLYIKQIEYIVDSYMFIQKAAYTDFLGEHNHDE